MTAYPDAILVREKAIYPGRYQMKTIGVLHKVVGVADLYAWHWTGREFEEIDPRMTKRIVTGDANAEKDRVAEMLEDYVGPQRYACDDESDAVAVGVAWLIQNKIFQM